MLKILNIVVGLSLMLGGMLGAERVLERGDPGHIDHPLIYFFGAVAMFGALMLPGIFQAAKPVIDTVKPLVPRIGRRSSSQHIEP